MEASWAPLHSNLFEIQLSSKGNCSYRGKRIGSFLSSIPFKLNWTLAISSIQLPRPFLLEINEQSDLNGTEVRKFQLSSTAPETFFFKRLIEFQLDFNGIDAFQPSSKYAETDFPRKLIGFQLDLKGTELRKLQTLLSISRDWFPVEINWFSIRFKWNWAPTLLYSCRD